MRPGDFRQHIIYYIEDGIEKSWSAPAKSKAEFLRNFKKHHPDVRVVKVY